MARKKILSRNGAGQAAKTVPATRRPATIKRARKRIHRVEAKTVANQAAFLEQFSKVGIITTAAVAIGIDRKRHYEWLADIERYPDYARRFEDAAEQAADHLEAEMLRRGVDGLDEPVYGPMGPGQGHGIIGTRKVYSDRLLELALRARRPDRFARKQVAHSGPEGQSIAVQFYLPKKELAEGGGDG